MLWDLFCRVIDNHGDVGVAWRLSADLAARGERVRLWLDDAGALRWMAPDGAPGVDVHHWPDAPPRGGPGDVVIELFGCELPPPWIAAMAARRPAPRWVNLEYLTAEAYAERSHGLRSPLSGPAAGLGKRFFFPGFTRGSGGLLREPGLVERRAVFDRLRWLSDRGWPPAPGERVVVLFCYDSPALPALLALLEQQPTLLLACPGPAQGRLRAQPVPHSVRAVALPWLTQPEFDRLLWSGDLNFVRGEDSFVRAMWAGAPFVWHIYPQSDGAHAAKLEAFIDRFEQGTGRDGAVERRALLCAWNGLAPWPQRLPAERPWRQACEDWRSKLLGQEDLTSRLLRFVGPEW
jgi:uncharacterized repeat protein (TIGR03837 family)